MVLRGGESMFQNEKLQAETGDTEVLKVAIFINYVEHGLNSIISPSKVPVSINLINICQITEFNKQFTTNC